MILVTGATGHIGRHLVERLIQEKRAVRVLLPESKQQNLPWAQDSVEVVTGHVLDEEAVFRAVTGVHTIFHLESAQWWGRQRDLERVEIVGTRNLISAARSARIGRMIVLSHLGASPSAGFNLLRTKGQLEDLIRNSGLAYTIIRSALVFGPEDAFINHLAMVCAVSPGFFLMPGHGEVNVQPIYIDDLIEVLFRSLERIEVVDETLEIGGPEYVTVEDLVRTVQRVIRAPRVIVRTPPYMIRWLTILYSLVFPRSLITPQWLDILASNRVARLGNTYSYFGVRPRRLEDTLMGYMPKRRHFFAAIRYVFKRRPRES